jgi:hypothetical protein
MDPRVREDDGFSFDIPASSVIPAKSLPST